MLLAQYGKHSSYESELLALEKDANKVTLNKSFRILIAEDSILHRNLLQHILTGQFNIEESLLVFVDDGE
jgi:hypothetical protein